MSAKIIFSCLLVLINFVNISFAQSVKQKIIVGTKIAEPFVIEDESGNFNGLSFELWNKLAEDLKIEYEIKKYDLEGLINAVKLNEVDIAISPLTITSDREKILDFSHTYFSTGLSIAVSNEEKSNLLDIFKNFFSYQFLNVMFLILITLFIVGLLVWLFERKRNKEEFGEGVTKGIGSSFWWAAVTMTTVGYGDKAPKTVGGRFIGLIWMFAGLIMISSFTAAITSALTVEQLEYDINELSDIRYLRVGTIGGSSSQDFLTQNGINYITVDNVDKGLNMIKEYKLDAFVHDAPILKYYVKSQNCSNVVKVLPLILNPINYGFAMPTNSQLREPINRVLLKEIHKKSWEITVNSYLGF